MLGAIPKQVATILLVSAVLGLLIYIALSSVAVRRDYRNSGQEIVLGLVDYATDHDGVLPDASNGTGIFSALYSGGYLSNPRLMFIPKFAHDYNYLSYTTPKVALSPGMVCWDVTARIDGPFYLTETPEDLPLVISSGLGTFDYRDGNNRMVLRSDLNKAAIEGNGVLVFFKDQSLRFRKATISEVDVTEDQFETGGRKYRNLPP